MTPKVRKLLIHRIQKKGKILSDSEAFDFYTEHVMRNDATCKWNPYWKEGTGKHEDYSLYELKSKAKQWHKTAIGSLAIDGTLVLEIK